MQKLKQTIQRLYHRCFVWSVAKGLYRLRVSQLEHIPAKGPALLICNHVSLIDWLLITAAVPRPIYTIMDHRFAKGIFMSRLAAGARLIPIARSKDNPDILAAAFRRTRQLWDEGQLVLLFPEGEVFAERDVKEFRAGVERLLENANVPVVPLAIAHFWGDLFGRNLGTTLFKIPKKFWIRPHLKAGPPIFAARPKKEYLRTQISRLIQES